MNNFKNILVISVFTLASVRVLSQVADFDIDTNQICASLAGASKIVITNNSVPATGKVFSDYTYTWSIGGIKPYDKADVKFTQNLSAPGLYIIKLEMKLLPDNKLVRTKDTTFFARPYPNAWFSVADTFNLGALTYRFRSGKAPSDTITYNYTWRLDVSDVAIHNGAKEIRNKIQRDTLLVKFNSGSTSSHKMYLTVKDNFGCSDKFDTTFTVSEKLVVPKFFTPNGDNKNDYLMAETNGRDIYRFEVFTSRGQRIFSSKSTSIMWDGIIEDSGQPAPAGTYYYYIEPVGLTAKTKESGFFVLFREK
jgi:gliding motility-associated-like protein